MPIEVPRRARGLVRVLAWAGLVVATTAALNVALGADAAAQDGRPDEELVARGSQVYGTQCATCHGEQGRGDPTRDVPGIQDAGPAGIDFVIETGRMPISDVDQRPVHREQIIPDADKRALIAYVQTFPGEGPEIPDVGDWRTASLSHGLELFTDSCAACHGPTAAGIAVGQEDISSSLHKATPLEIAEAIRIGPGVMPVFSEAQYPQEDLEATIRWIMHLRERAAPGGAQIGRSGPVSEGLIAWVVGMGLLTIVIYLLGEKVSDEEDGDGRH